MRKYLLLFAEKHNWGILGPGMWRSVTWKIYSNGIFEKVTVRIPEIESQSSSKEDSLRRLSSSERFQMLRLKELKESGITAKEDYSVVKGNLSPEYLFYLLKECEADWMDPSVNSECCDGEARQIQMYSPEGKILKSTGDKVGYIYGQKKIEQIIYMLP